ncbi:MAG TPA: phosphate signaling complex protein PhoU [Acidobacteriota bacterium]|jgi:phosphate transport system protein|nr:phosphate signaling complex protein PhoU [Acidobacteriota bacterium]
MTKQFEEDLGSLKQQLLKMASKAETMIHLSMQALVKRDKSLAAELPELEEDVNRLQLDIDDRCFKLLALRQPMAHDLRFIVAAGKISSDLERIGDLTINIIENTRVLLEFPELKPLIDIPKMAELSRQMVRDSLDAFVEEDANKARATVMRDDEVDSLKNQVFREVLTYMISDPQTIQVGMQLILVSRHLERIADHATNIAEDVVYLVEAKDIRHHAEEAK